MARKGINGATSATLYTFIATILLVILREVLRTFVSIGNFGAILFIARVATRRTIANKSKRLRDLDGVGEKFLLVSLKMVMEEG